MTLPRQRVSTMRMASMALALFASRMPMAAAGEALNQPPAGFIALFNGKDLSGWHGMGNVDPRKLWAMSDAERAAMRQSSLEDVQKHWRVENGELVNDGDGLYLTTDRDYGDIEFWIDYKTVALADSGIYLRGNPQVQIWDYTKEGGKWNLGANWGSGGLWNNGEGAPGKDPLVLADKPFGEWNRFRIVQVTDRTWVWLNERLVVDGARMENLWDRSQPLWPRGPIQLQTHGGEIRWRNVFLREIPPEETRKWLARGFQPIFNGKDFSGWEGAFDGYEVADGAIRCKAGSGGNLFTREVYGDFVLRLEIQIPPGGNNGILVRYPGSGDGAYTGMCELQVLDNEHPKYKDQLDRQNRQCHGAIYGMVGAKRGHLKPAGEWNYQQVTVVGSRIKVELNGVVITEGDVSRVKEFMAGSREKHKGIDRLRGRLGFAGHGDAVAFRNVEVLRLE
jgi:hypothetical protein